MNKYYFLAAVAVITLGSCTQDEETPERQEVGFNAITKKNTRSIVTENHFDTTNDKFNVWGFYDQDAIDANSVNLTGTSVAPNFMNNVEISYVTTPAPVAWRNLENHYYWPLVGKVGFYALYPSSKAPSSITWDGGMKINDYTITDLNSSGDDAMDLMYAYGESGRTPDELSMIFKHALSQILFRFKTNASYPGATIRINSITLKNVDLSGDFSFMKPDVASWADNTTKSVDFVYYGSQSEDAVPVVAPAVAPDYGLPIVFIPQSATASQEAEINFTIHQENSTDIVYTLPISLVTSTGTWDMGKRYVYTINFKLNEILYNPSVSTWLETIVDDINLYDDVE